MLTHPALTKSEDTYDYNINDAGLLNLLLRMIEQEDALGDCVAHLHHLDFKKNTDLSGVNFSETIINLCTFNNTNLERASFHSAKITYSRFCEANLNNTLLQALTAKWSTFKHAGMKGTNLCDSTLYDVNMDGVAFNVKTEYGRITWDKVNYSKIKGTHEKIQMAIVEKIKQHGAGLIALSKKIAWNKKSSQELTQHYGDLKIRYTAVSQTLRKLNPELENHHERLIKLEEEKFELVDSLSEIWFETKARNEDVEARLQALSERVDIVTDGLQKTRGTVQNVAEDVLDIQDAVHEVTDDIHNIKNKNRDMANALEETKSDISKLQKSLKARRGAGLMRDVPRSDPELDDIKRLAKKAKLHHIHGCPYDYADVFCGIWKLVKSIRRMQPDNSGEMSFEEVREQLEAGERTVCTYRPVNIKKFNPGKEVTYKMIERSIKSRSWSDHSFYSGFQSKVMKLVKLAIGNNIKDAKGFGTIKKQGSSLNVNYHSEIINLIFVAGALLGCETNRHIFRLEVPKEVSWLKWTGGGVFSNSFVREDSETSRLIADYIHHLIGREGYGTFETLCTAKDFLLELSRP